ncbi:MAG TPA: DUF2127 domain-containing protein [Candidatus Methylacidiphilales bacterium]|nr:DUF2127 domain-containing protein [Candidatus Methylacidiphilales bacterium]
MSEKPPPDPLLRLIALFKLAKSFLFICAGFGLLHFLNKDVEAHLQVLMNSLHVDSDNHLAKWCLDEAGLLSKVKIEALSAIAFFYGILFGIEGTGLYLRKRWAEWFVVIMTGSLLPLEIYEIIHRVTPAKIALTAGNLIILGYLIYVIWRKQETEK